MMMIYLNDYLANGNLIRLTMALVNSNIIPVIALPLVINLIVDQESIRLI